MVGAIEPLLRAKLLMALLGLIVLGLGLMVLIIMGGRYARRIARTSLPPSQTHDDRWYAKPLVPEELDSSSNDGDESEPGRPSESEGERADNDADDGGSGNAGSPDGGPDEPGPHSPGGL
jgi:hypothetical protein